MILFFQWALHDVSSSVVLEFHSHSCLYQHYKKVRLGGGQQLGNILHSMSNCFFRTFMNFLQMRKLSINSTLFRYELRYSCTNDNESYLANGLRRRCV